MILKEFQKYQIIFCFEEGNLMELNKEELEIELSHKHKHPHL